MELSPVPLVLVCVLFALWTGGAMVMTERSFGVGAILRLQIGEKLSKLAEICWTEEGRIGLSFLQPMTIEDLAVTALALQPCDAIRDDSAATSTKVERAA